MRLTEVAKRHPLVTVELIPDRLVPADLSLLRGRVDGITVPALRNGSHDPSYPAEFHVTPQQRSIASAIIIKRAGVEAIPSLTCRDCRRSDLLTKPALLDRGLENFLIVFGDPYPDFNPKNYDFPRTDLLIRELLSSYDGERPCLGTVTNQYAANKEREVSRTLGKVDAGADYVITNVAFDDEAVLEHTDHLRSQGLNVPLLVQVSIPSSQENLLFVSRKFGIPVPAHVTKELSTRPVDGGLTIAAQAYDALRSEAQGIHFSYLLRSHNPIPPYCRLLDLIGVHRPALAVEVKAALSSRNLT